MLSKASEGGRAGRREISLEVVEQAAGFVHQSSRKESGVVPKGIIK